VVFSDDKYRYHVDQMDLPEGGTVTKITNNGLVYVMMGETVLPSGYSPNTKDEKVWYQWDKDAYPMYSVTVKFNVPITEETPNGMAMWTYLMNSDEVKPYELYVDSVWRGYMVDPMFMGKYKVGIYMRHNAHEHGMIHLYRHNEGEPMTMKDTRQFFGVPLGKPFISGPYPD